MLILASRSAGRRALLNAAAVPHEAVSPQVDEDAAKAALRADGLGARDLADALAEFKTLKLSAKWPGDLILGCDQTLEIDQGAMLDKPVDREAARAQLKLLSGRSHKLHSAAVISEAGRPVWRQIESATLTMRPLSDAFIESYLDAEWEEARWCVGCYRIEGPGIQLFDRIAGSQFAIVGLPLLPLLAYLRVRGVLPS